MTPQIKHIMKKINITKKVKNDIILTASILIVAVLVFFIISLISNNGNYVEIKKNGEIIGVLDIDSPIKNRFTEADQEGLEAFVAILENVL